MRLPGLRDVDAAHDRLVLRKDVDEAFLLESHQRIAHRRLTDAEARRELGARQEHPGWQFERDDPLVQVIDHLGRRMARSIETPRRPFADGTGHH
jgi:hypothetical protein